MTYKKSLLFFAAIMVFGVAAYMALHNGQYPISIVNSHIITASTVEKNFVASLTYLQNAALVYRSNPALLETAAARGEIKRATLDKLITDALILSELKTRVSGEEIDTIADTKINQFLYENSDVERAAQALYGLSLAEFKSRVLIPQAYREILEGRMFLAKEDFGAWLSEAKRSARVLVFISDLEWTGEQISIKK
ncbi:MAG: hypothetical protein A3H63_02610 [Candidatus Harrisonbacteria bacterium RIFCSPLOWO2_02_FULL_45_10c]|uniref:Uncharacterized protein n=1 Tax=Candidatus Harrisonbacteria bacterium RIFCSPLOWO2_02_FULL_45_10c TaxID=1798410 RepID=A0A1G1ZRV1_9BACT|nr:MAG: hypothetical protein A3H63_02610 [Candidatus Harrisonbacteria bacterium RIFCSPLOWO2_02_FULL_45_10c]